MSLYDKDISLYDKDINMKVTDSDTVRSDFFGAFRVLFKIAYLVRRTVSAAKLDIRSFSFGDFFTDMLSRSSCMN